MPDELALCYGMSEWFEDTDPLVHKECAKLCRRCPVIDWCRTQAEDLLAQGKHIEGTWAAERYVGLKAPTVHPKCGSPSGFHYHRKAGEDTCDACLAAKREYERNRVRRSRAAKVS